jgi:hypothetical protein
MRRLITSLMAATLVAGLSVGSAFAGNGPPHVGFYIDGATYLTVGTPTDFFGTGAPASTFDRIYDLGGNGVLNVAEAKPGDRDFNGGRWMVFPVTWHVAPYQLTSAEAVLAAADAGQLTIATEPVKEFLCPVIRAH